jgi:hypothetical protein
MRLYGISPGDVDSVIVRPTTKDLDEQGNLRLTGVDRNGRAIIVLIAEDDPDFVITTFPDD